MIPEIAKNVPILAKLITVVGFFTFLGYIIKKGINFITGNNT